MTIEPFGLELLPKVADLARAPHSDLGDTPRDLFADLTATGHKPDGTIFIERPDRGPLITAWLDL